MSLEQSLDSKESNTKTSLSNQGYSIYKNKKTVKYTYKKKTLEKESFL